MHLILLLLIGTSLNLKLSDIKDREHHLICHSHDDLGWLKTVDEYYRDSVKSIFETVLESLDEPQSSERTKRKFIYSEVGFLKMFIEENKETRQTKIDKIKKFIHNRQWEWVNGGMSQADEACPFYEDVINNYFYGQRYLQTNFGAISKTVWQVDPFGHSLSFFYIASKFGMTHGVFWRMDEQTRRRWADEKHLQMVYKLPEDREMILHVNYGYFAPDSIGCDQDCAEQPFDSQKFEEDCSNNDKNFLSDTMFLVGGDFQWPKAQSRYTFLDGVVNQYQTVKYSLFSEYAAAFEVKVPHEKLPVYDRDFFVYDEGADEKGDSWSGYFTTKPYLKYKIRRIGRLLRTVTLMMIAPKESSMKSELLLEPIIGGDIFSISEDFGILLHHDSITGTSKEAVDRDYFDRIDSIEKRLYGLFSSYNMACDYNDIYSGKIDECVYMSTMRTSRRVMLLMYNSQPHTRDAVAHFLIPKIHEKQEVIIQTFGRDDIRGQDMFCRYDKNLCSVYFDHAFWAGEYQQYYVQIRLPKNELTLNDNKETKSLNSEQQAIPLEGPTMLKFSNFSLLIKQDCVEYYNEKGEYTNKFTFLYMDAMESGHYILKYNKNYEQKVYNQFAIYYTFEGSLIEGVFLYGQKINLKIIKEKKKKYFTFESRVRNDNAFKAGIDVLLKIETPTIENTKDIFYTDANGLFELQRKKQTKFENNVYPVASYAKVVCDSGNKGLYVFNDRTQGAYVDKNSLFFYLQRSAKQEDHKGNEEVLRVTENNVIRHIIYNYEETDEVDDTVVEIMHSIDAELFPVTIPMTESEEVKMPSKIAQKLDNLNEFVHAIDAVLFPGITPETESEEDDLSSIISQKRDNLNEFVPQIRMNVQVIDNNRVLLRYQNISRKKTIKVNFKETLRRWYPKKTVKEVDFDYLVEDEKNERELKDSYEILPLQFVSIIRMNKKIIAIEG